MTSHTLKWTPLEGDPPYINNPKQNNVIDVSCGATPSCQFPIPAAPGYGIYQVFCKTCRHMQNLVMTGLPGDTVAYKVECRKVRAVQVVECVQMEMSL